MAALWRVALALGLCGACAGSASRQAPAGPAGPSPSASGSSSWVVHEEPQPKPEPSFAAACSSVERAFGEDVCRETDINHDGRPDVFERRRGGWVILKRFDLDFDGKSDQWVWIPDPQRTACTVTILDLNGDGAVDLVQDPCSLRQTQPRPPGLPADPWP